MSIKDLIAGLTERIAECDGSIVINVADATTMVNALRDIERPRTHHAIEPHVATEAELQALRKAIREETGGATPLDDLNGNFLTPRHIEILTALVNAALVDGHNPELDEIADLLRAYDPNAPRTADYILNAYRRIGDGDSAIQLCSAARDSVITVGRLLRGHGFREITMRAWNRQERAYNDVWI